MKIESQYDNARLKNGGKHHNSKVYQSLIGGGRLLHNSRIIEPIFKPNVTLRTEESPENKEATRMPL